MLYRYIVIVVAGWRLFFTPWAAAETATLYGNLYGRITAHDSGEPLAGVLIYLYQPDAHPSGATGPERPGLDRPLPEAATRQGSSDRDGRYLINAVPVARHGRPYTIIFVLDGEVRLKIDQAIVLPGAVMALNIDVRLPARGKAGALTPETASNFAAIAYRYTLAKRAAPTDRPPPQAFQRDAEGDLTLTVFATREGLVGGTTANGHVIEESDHFVALPSADVLCTKDGHEFEVALSYNGRSEIAPVWDIGPWSLHDDYWAAEADRQIYDYLENGGQNGGLPPHVPAAQAAFQDDFNSGKDELGREVLNPAGIDLADGTFWDGLQLNDNTWITVQFLWQPDDDQNGTTDDNSSSGSGCFVQNLL